MRKTFEDLLDEITEVRDTDPARLERGWRGWSASSN
jgi:hypothetical protein